MAKIVEKIPAPRNKPTSNLNDEWGYLVIFSTGQVEFQKANLTNQEKLHALKNIYLIEV